MKTYKVLIKNEKTGIEQANGPYIANSEIGACVQHLNACGSNTRHLDKIPENYRVVEI